MNNLHQYRQLTRCPGHRRRLFDHRPLTSTAALRSASSLAAALRSFFCLAFRRTITTRSRSRLASGDAHARNECIEWLTRGNVLGGDATHAVRQADKLKTKTFPGLRNNTGENTPSRILTQPPRHARPSCAHYGRIPTRNNSPISR